MSQHRLRWPVLLLTLACGPSSALAQSATYHLHREASVTAALLQLKTLGPDAAKASVQSVDLKNRPAGEYAIKQFDTQPGVPNAAGSIPAGSSVSFTLWMKQTSNFGTMQPRARVRLNDAAGTELCHANGTTNLTTSLTAYALSCVLATSVVVKATDRLYVWVGVNLTSAPGNHGAGGELDIEGALNGAYDSRVTIPLPLPPAISAIAPASGAPTTSVTITGANFGPSQGSSTVTFNGAAAVPTSWSATSISAPAPIDASTGPVVVTVGGAASNGPVFTVLPPSIGSVAPASGRIGTPIVITGANFAASQGSSTVRFGSVVAAPTSWSDRAIVVSVPAGATSGNIAVSVGNQSSVWGPFVVIVPGSIGGAVTRASGGAAISGALVQAFADGVVAGSATTAPDGTYSMDSLDPRAYDVRITAAGFATELRPGVAVNAGGQTRLNIAASAIGVLSGTVTTGDGVTPVAGALVTVYASGLPQGSAFANNAGGYTIGSLRPAVYVAEAAAVGYQTAAVGVAIAENATTQADFALTAAATGTVSYAYDAIGRLIQVSDPSGASAIYRYDPAGNVIAIERPGFQGSPGLAISGISPSSGPVGTVVSVAGVGFSSNPANNAVTFNGISAAVTAAAAESLLTVVPPAATSGPVVVESAAGSAAGPVPFVVTADSGAPVITALAPTIGVPGSPLAISGSHFDPVLANNRVTVNTTWQSSMTSGNDSSLLLTVPGATMGGRIGVATPFGAAVSASDFFIPPAPYAAADVAAADRMSIGSSRNVSIPTPGKIALLLFDGLSGQHISLGTSNVAFTGDCIIGAYVVTILQPDGKTLASVGRGCSPGLFIDQQTLPASGTYTVLLSPILSNTGSLTVTLYDVIDVTGPVATDGTTVPATVSTPGQNIRLTFSGNSGQLVSAIATSSIWTSCQFGGQYSLAIAKPDGSNLVSVPNACGATTFIDRQMLPTTGVYTLTLDPYGANTGSASLAVFNIVDVTGPIVADGTSVPLAITTPGQNVRFTFNGSAGQIVGAWATASFWACTSVTFWVSIVKPDGSALRTANNVCGTAYTDQVTLPIDGTYTVAFDPAGTNTGTATLRFFTMIDATGFIVANGPSVLVTVTTPFQNARLTFDGTAGQVVTAVATSTTWTACVTTQFDLYLVNPDGSTLAGTFGCWGNAVLGQRTLPQTGTYTIRVDPRELNTGSATVSLTSP